MDGPSKRNSGPAAGSDGKSARKNIRIALVEGDSQEPRWLRGRSKAPSRKAEPAAEFQFPPVRSLRETHFAKGLIMEQLEIIDLGDAMTETRCFITVAPTFDSVYGPSHPRC